MKLFYLFDLFRTRNLVVLQGSRVIFSVCLVLASKVSFFLLFSLFLVLFMGLIVLFGTIHESHYTISDTF